MTLSTVVCCKCSKPMTGKDIKKLPFTQVVVNGRIRPVCDDCNKKDKKHGTVRRQD